MIQVKLNPSIFKNFLLLFFFSQVYFILRFRKAKKERTVILSIFMESKEAHDIPKRWNLRHFPGKHGVTNFLKGWDQRWIIQMKKIRKMVRDDDTYRWLLYIEACYTTMVKVLSSDWLFLRLSENLQVEWELIAACSRWSFWS